MSTDSGFSVNYTDVDEAIQVMTTQTAAIQTALDTLNSQFNKYIGDFIGATSTAYQADQAKWNANVLDMQELLSKISGGGTHIRENYIATDLAGANRFQV